MDLTAVEPVSPAVLSLCAGFNAFGLDLHRELPAGGNTFISPLSIGAALAALLPGARGETAAELARVLRVEGTAEDTARAMAELIRILEPRRTEEDSWNDETDALETVERESFRLSLATGLFVEEAYPLHTAFCDALTEAFGADFFSVTFADAEATASRVNAWVADKTEDRITDLVSPDSVLPDMRLILANAVYFKARWSNQFAEGRTRPKPFHLLQHEGTGTVDAPMVDVPMMAQHGTFLYWKSESADAEALRIDYEEGLSMLVVLPATGRFAEAEAGLSADLLARMHAGSEWTLVDLELPRFEMRFETELGDVLRELGLQTAFDIASADFGGITPHPDGLFLSEAIHQAWLNVDEQGTEAAAATALGALGAGIEEEPPQPIPFVVDRPFYFFIQERLTGAVLFMGRVLDPTA